MYRRRYNTNNILIFVIIILLIALVLALIFGDFSAEEEDPQIIVDGNLVMEYAGDFGVSIEFLQMILPDYLVYTVGGEYRYHHLDSSVALNDYNWDALSYTEDGRIWYNDENYANVTYGIDVSTYQGEIDWQAVAAEGIDFAMIRIGFRGYESGRLVLDEHCISNIEGALAAGLEVGAYFFSQAITEDEAIEEAEMVIDTLEGYEITYPIAFDMEEITGANARTDSLDIETTTAITKAFCKRIQDAGYEPMIYGNTKWVASRIDIAELKRYPLWFAQYYTKPLMPYDFAMWQYTNSGSVAGIEGYVDLNICFKQPWLD